MIDSSSISFLTFSPQISTIILFVLLHLPRKSQVLSALTTVIAYQTTLTFWTAAFPTLARNTPELRASAQAYTSGTISRAEYDHADMLQRSRLANTAFYFQSLGELIILAAIVGILFALDVHASEANNNWGLSVLIAFATGVWLLLVSSSRGTLPQSMLLEDVSQLCKLVQRGNTDSDPS